HRAGRAPAGTGRPAGRARRSAKSRRAERARRDERLQHHQERLQHRPQTDVPRRPVDGRRRHVLHRHQASGDLGGAGGSGPGRDRRTGAAARHSFDAGDRHSGRRGSARRDGNDAQVDRRDEEPGHDVPVHRGARRRPHGALHPHAREHAQGVRLPRRAPEEVANGGRMRFVKLAVSAAIVGAATIALAQEPSTRVWGVRVLASDVEAVATFYEKTFAMSETARPVNSATAKEIVLNFGQTPELARRATTPPIVIYTRPATAPAGAMASLILRVADLDKAIDAVKANGGTLMAPPHPKRAVELGYAVVQGSGRHPDE